MKTYEILKRHCQYIWFVGSGNFWFEDGVVRSDTSLAYRIFQVILISTYVIMTLVEIVGAFYGDFPKDEHGDCVTFSVSHTIVLLKLISILRNKELIKSLNKRLVTVCEEFEDEAVMLEKFRIIKFTVYAYFANVYGAVICFICEGFRKLFAEGSHFVTVVTYYPSYENNSAMATAVRILMTIILSAMMMTMIISVDAFALMHLIMIKYKIITLRNYFEEVRQKFDEESKMNIRMASKNLMSRLKKGIVMHGELIRMCKDIHQAFGTVFSLQLCLSFGSVLSLLLQLALATDVTFVVAAKIILFAGALYFLLALFLCNTGDITYQAFLLSDAIFYCGWHMSDSQRQIRPVVLLAIKQAQQPLVMKAFKMIQLTYGTFLQVVRTTYSVFALLYAHNK